MSISIKELNKNNVELTPEQEQNLKVLHEKMNKIRTLWGRPMIVTSGVRSMADHLRIYRELAEKRGKEFDESKVPMGSMHLKASACDISDPDGKLFDWCKANEEKLAEIGLWLEEKDDQARVHFQIFQYRSWAEGKSRFFKV